MQKTITAEEYKQMLSAPKQFRKSKHRNIPVYMCSDGFANQDKTVAQAHGPISQRFGSIKEYNRYCELQMLEKAGLVSDVKCQVPFILQDAYVSKDGKEHKAAVYVADFVYNDLSGNDSVEVVEDVKGFNRKTGKHLTTETFRLKWKLLQARYSDKTFRLY